MIQLRTYLFLPQGIVNKQLTRSYIAVKQAYINYEIAEKTERVGNYGILFTTEKNLKEVTDKLKMKDGESYLLVEITDNITSEAISGFMPNTNIEEIRNLNLENIKDNAKWLKLELDDAVKKEDFERAAKLRDKINKNNE